MYYPWGDHKEQISDRIKALKKDGYVENLVTDNGRGMSAEKTRRIQAKLD
ncbi:hypothetical protein [Streptococcus infantis]|nr:hypothetical protein [Streptococcus infantis]